ncbi:MAG: leucine-rich repeat domain-containing protein [Candidatus Melainabacteria bacterium]|nr:leucine-rich repeat domain-containing protein [Candidatus Melainabacteria bacterium]
MSLNLDIVFLVNRFTVESGRELNVINHAFRDVNSFTIRTVASSIIADAKNKPTALQRYIYSLRNIPLESEIDCRDFFKVIFLKAKEYGISEAPRVMGPVHVDFLSRRIEDAALERIWRDICLALERIDSSKDFDRRLKAPAIRRCLKENEHLAAQVRFLNLGNKKLSFLPREILFFSGLYRLLLISNNFEEFPPEICELRSLKELQFSLNKLRSLPPEIKNLKDLKILDLQQNRLDELPAEVGELSALESLYLYQNCLTTLPKELGSLSSLKILEAKENLIHSIPAELLWLAPQLRLDVRRNGQMISFHCGTYQEVLVSV